jgi:GT2 family glycosyltransferase
MLAELRSTPPTMDSELATTPSPITSMRFGGFIITYDRPAILRQTIASVLAQSRPPERLLVPDNGRNPETEAVVAEFPPQVVRYHMGGNCAPAGTAAFALAQLVRDGRDWVWWGDDDDPPALPIPSRACCGLLRAHRQWEP